VSNLGLEKILFLFACLFIYLNIYIFFLQRCSWLCFKILFGWWDLGPSRRPYSHIFH